MLLTRKLSCVTPLASSELASLADLQRNAVCVKPGTELIHEGQGTHRAFVLHSGWACRYKHLPEGSRQIISFPLPGDFIGLGCILLQRSNHSCVALTDAVVSSVSASSLTELFQNFPRLAAAILWAAARDEAMIIEHLVDLGRRNAVKRLAHCMLELEQRLRLVGLATETGFECPLTQYDLADALGLSPIHVSRVLRYLREHELLTLKSHTVTFHDRAALHRLAGYDSGYLDQICADWSTVAAPKDYGAPVSLSAADG
jgi:CRP-like cAMP-binding protein